MQNNNGGGGGGGEPDEENFNGLSYTGENNFYFGGFN